MSWPKTSVSVAGLNSPFGLDWSRSEPSVRHEHETMGLAGRFGPGLPHKSDSTLLFLLHMLSKMKPLEQGGARLVFLTAGSSLWTGDAESGESNIRRHLIERDMLEGIVALPPGLLPHTGIPSYVWVVTNRKQESRRGHVRLIDGSGFFEPAPRSAEGAGSEPGKSMTFFACLPTGQTRPLSASSRTMTSATFRSTLRRASSRAPARPTSSPQWSNFRFQPTPKRTSAQRFCHIDPRRRSNDRPLDTRFKGSRISASNSFEP